MFGLLISEDNLPKIREFLSPNDVSTMGLYLHPAIKEWYIVRGYYNDRGNVVDWVVLPKYILDADYEYDALKIRTEWDQIVRKNSR